MRTELLRFNGAVERAPAIDAWMREHAGELAAIARQWFEVMRKCGDEVRELLPDGRPLACLGDAPFSYVNVFASHVNVGCFHGAALPDPARLLKGTGKFMRRVKLRPETPTNATNAAALTRLIDAAYSDIKRASKTASSEKRLRKPRVDVSGQVTSAMSPVFAVHWRMTGKPPVFYLPLSLLAAGERIACGENDSW